jgi:mannose/cellobiose epimerase-like protein (N-acyl-D-glucosamine 2-epimerase family)
LNPASQGGIVAGVNTLGARTCLVSLLTALFSFVAIAAGPSTFEKEAGQWRTELRDRIMPYWYDTAQDTRRGGYLLADNLEGRGEAREKQLVGQTRMIWTFAHVHLSGLEANDRDYLQAAEQGYHFLQRHFLDPQHGGYFWKTDLDGSVIHDCKFLYGQSFVLYALVEYHRASGDPEPLRQAMNLYQLLQRKLHDTVHGGWLEHTEADWQPLKPGDPRNQVEVVGYKSANAHLHWMEALAELYEVSQDPKVRESLIEALHINSRYFYPLDAGQSCFHRQRDWTPVTDPQSAGLSYGHNVEFAWLMIRAEQVLDQAPSWNHFYAHLDHALDYGYDHRRGGLYNRGFGNEPASDTRKIWWVQAEMLAALTDALAHRPNPRYERALRQLIDFVWAHQVDPRDGIWLDTVSAEGKRENTAKAHSWKANYHDVRAIVKFIQTFGR